MSSKHRGLPRSGRRTAGLVTVCFLLLAPAAERPAPPPLADFFEQFRAAARSGEARRLAVFAHPASRACGVAGDPEAWARIAAQFSRVFGHDRPLGELEWEPVDPEALAEAKARMARRGGARFPIDPEGALEAHWDVGAGRARASQLHVARDADGRWRWVHVCLSPAP